MNGYNNNKYKQRKHYEIEDPKFSFFNHNIYVVFTFTLQCPFVELCSQKLSIA